MRVRLLALLASVTLMLPLVAYALTESAHAAPAPSRHTNTGWSSSAEFSRGIARGVTISNGTVRFARPISTGTVGSTRYDVAQWISPVTTPTHAFTELIPSWSAATPGVSWVKVSARAWSAGGAVSGWKSMARWREALGRTSFGPQTDRVARASTDTLVAASGVSLRRFQVKFELLRKTGSAAQPSVSALNTALTQVGAVPATSKPLFGARSLAVPTYSQMTHRGEYPQYGGGGQAWCSPTSLSMVLGYYRRLPSAREYSWVNPAYRDRWVDHVARSVYDSGYRGAGNWAFNTAYAASRLPGGSAYVARLDTLRDVERFIARGIPVQVSISFSSGQLSGAPIRSTAGHLVLVTGFTSTGAVIVHDPAAPGNSSVRRVYNRAQFERAWLTRSHGTAYLIRDSAHTFPAGYRA